MIILGQRGNSGMLPLASEVHFLPLQGVKLVRLWMFISGSSFQGVFLLQADPVCKQAHISLQ